MNPFRCSNCDKLLGMIEGKAEIKCSKCKAINTCDSSDYVMYYGLPIHRDMIRDDIYMSENEKQRILTK